MTPHTQVDKKVVDRLRSLLALARDERGNEHVANLAMERAQELMRRHNLTMATIEASGGKSEARTKGRTERPLMFKWQQHLISAIARVNFCHFSITHKTTRGNERIAGGYEVIGRVSNVVAVNNMFDYLTETLARLVRQECGTSSSDQFTRFAHSFRLGCVDRLAERLTERHDQQLAEQEREVREEKARRSHPASASRTTKEDGTPFYNVVVTLTDFAQTEADLNEDMRRGKAPGTTAAERAKWKAEAAAEQEERRVIREGLIAQGVPSEIASYMASGYSRAEAERLCKPMTDAQARREDRRNRRYWDTQDARARREAKKVDRHGFETGRRLAEHVGLDDQVDYKEQRKLG